MPNIEPAPRIDEESLEAIEAILERATDAPLEIVAMEHPSPELAGEWFAKSLALSNSSLRVFLVIERGSAEPTAGEPPRPASVAIMGNGLRALENARLVANARATIEALLEERNSLLQEIQALRAELGYDVG